MGRTKEINQLPAVMPALLPGKAAELMAKEDELALLIDQQNARVTAIARKLNYHGSTSLDALENSARDAIRRIGMAVFELGGYLLMLREGCPHGQFLPVLERLKLEKRAAQQYMQVTHRFSNTQTSAHLEALGVSKLTEMLVMDDEQIEELTERGQTGELALDDVATMSVRELRAAVRKERTVKDRLEAVNQELHSENINLKLDKKIVALTDWPDALIPVTDQIAMAGRKLAQAVSELETCRITIFTKAQDLEDDDRASLEAALAHVAEIYEEALNRAERSLARERLTFDKTLGALAPDA